jgi:glycosyltransferase involved in cell wall biosynthesis
MPDGPSNGATGSTRREGAATSGGPMRISVLTPTYGREERLPKLYGLFCSQTHADKELIVLDDSPEPSPFFSELRDPRVRYLHSPQRLVLGEKRNRLARESTGDVLMHFDDDDYYAPTYVEKMLALLGEDDLMKLTAFYIYSLVHDLFCYWDTAKVADVHLALDSHAPVKPTYTAQIPQRDREDWALRNQVGFGFSFVFRRKVWERVPYEPIGHGEDFKFVFGALDAGFRVSFKTDQSGLALVLRHPNDRTVVFPQFTLPNFLLPVIFGKPLTDYLLVDPSPAR